MKHRKILSLLLFLSLSFAVLASNDKGIELYKAGMYGATKDFFMQQTNQTTEEQVMAAYYLGLIYSNEQNIQAAATEFQKAVDIAPKSPYGYIGKGRLELKNDVQSAEKLLKQAEGLGKKNVDVWVQIADAYCASDMTAKAQSILEKAKTVDSKYPDIYLLEGDMILKQNVDSETIGKAINKFEDADYFSQNTSKLALVKLAKLYNLINGQNLALEKVNMALALDSNYLPAYIALGDIKYAQSWYKEAIAAYEKVIAECKVPVEVYENYAPALYFDKQYQKSLDEIEKVLKQNPDDATLNRLEAYNLYELEKYDEGLQKMEKFLSTIPQDKQIYLDFITLGRFCAKQKKYDTAIENFNKAIDLDSNKADAYKELALAYAGLKKYEESITYFEKYFTLTQNILPSELNAFGEICTNAAALLYSNNRTDVKALEVNLPLFNSYIEKGAKAYTNFILLAPDLQIGYFGRAYIYSLVDAYQYELTGKHSGIARAYYDEALDVMLKNNNDGRFNRNIIDCYLYYAGYYIKNDNTKAAVDCYRKILAIDPENATAKETLKQLKVKI
ncbi:MAG: tetratricopeptide repeat protein [Bacteroidales bacterium]|jgi:tetratricopeptide (TPR) repeat protein|nr:tetratricopeptide repeat protein [Bacteroidales bacterium]